MESSQPPEPQVEAPPAAESTVPAPPTLTAVERAKEAKAQRRRTMRQFLVVGLCAFALLCLGGIATAFIVYDKATKPDLGTPSLVTRKYLSAYFVDRDDAAAAQYACSDSSGLSEIHALRSDLDNRQKTYNLKITVSVDRVQETSRSGDEATVVADIVISAVDEGDQLNRVQHWEIGTHNESGWRVCTTHQATQ